VKIAQNWKPFFRSLYQWITDVQWTDLRRIGMSKASRWSAIWLAAIPAAARFTSSLPPEIELPMNGRWVTLNIDLPFSWICLFFASLAFSAGNLIFSFCCPPFIKLYGDFEEFTRKTGGSATSLGHWNQRQLGEIHPPHGYANEDERGQDIFAKARRFEKDYALTYIETFGPGDPNGVREPNIPDAFVEIEYDAETLRPKWKIACAVVYVLGFILLSYTGLTAVKWMIWDYLLGW